IMDLCHFGVPDWLESFQNPEFPRHFAEYAHAFAERYPWVRFYTPINEMYIAAQFSAFYGWWNERLASHQAFVTALKHIVDANEHLLVEEDRAIFAGEVFGYYVVTRDYYNRYNLPVMHTETNKEDPDAERWLWKTWANIQRLRVDGVPLCGMTWYSLTDQVDWDTALREENGHVNPLGLYDLDRKLRPVGKAYQELIRQWSDTPLL